MRLPVHNPARPRVAKKKTKATKEKHMATKKKRAKAKRKKKTTTKRTAPRRKNASRPRKRKTIRAASRARTRAKNPSRPKARKSARRRRRNPETTGGAVKAIAKGLGVAVAASAVTIIAATFAGEHAPKVYAAAGITSVVGGALLAKNHPNAGLGLALGGAGVSLFPLVGGTIAGQVAAAQLQPSGDKMVGMGAVTYDRMGAIVRNVSNTELGLGPNAATVSNVPVRQLGMGAVTYDRMGAVTYDRMGAVSVDHLARQGNPFAG